MKFTYQARTLSGETQNGTIEASSSEAALSLLARRSLYVTILEESGKEPFFAKRLTFFEGVSLQDVMSFSRQLSIMFKAQVPLVEILQTIGSQMKNSGFREKLMKISDQVEAGASFSKALNEFPSVFSPFYINMVKSGEVSGKLSEVLAKLADHLEREYDILSKVKGAMIYPIFVLVLSGGLLLLMLFFIIPNLTALLKETEQELPPLTKATIAFADFARAWGWAMLIAIFGSIIFFMRWMKTQEGKKVMDRVVLHVPVLKTALQTLYLSRFSENLATLIASGIPITQALEISGSTIGNSVYEEAIAQAKQTVSEGDSISNSLERYRTEFPPIFTHMVKVGEKSGNLEETLLSVSHFYQKEVNRTLEALLALLEPVLIVFLVLGVAFLMAAVVLPLYQLSTV
ncbi:MAG: type II secretion system F family protein [bacterium]|nr:type II secretion system F family protein [bacterium]